MAANGLPRGVVQLLARFEAGALTADDRDTIARVLIAAADSRSSAEMLAANSRNRRDDALREMCLKHYADVPLTRAAKNIEKYLKRYAVSGWPNDRRANGPPTPGTKNYYAFEVLNAVDGTAPSWRTIYSSLQRSPLAVATPAAPKG